MRVRTLVTATAAAMLLAVPTPAVAGGWATGIVVRDPLGVGETVTAEARVHFRTAEAAMDAGEYHAYLLQDVDERMLAEAMGQPQATGWWEPPASLTWLAEVELSARSSNMMTATATFEVPDVPTGEYAVMFCTAGCEDAMANVAPRMQVRVFPDSATAQLAREVAAMPQHVTDEVNRVLDGVGQLRTHVLSTAQRMTETRDDLSEVERSLTVLETASEATPAPPVDAGSPWTEHAGWFVAGLGTAAALAARRRRRSDTPSDDDLPPVPDDAGELVTGPPVPASSIRR